MVNSGAASFVRKQVAEAKAQGAQALVSEDYFATSRDGTPFLGPTVLVDVNHSMSVMRDESLARLLASCALVQTMRRFR